MNLFTLMFVTVSLLHYEGGFTEGLSPKTDCFMFVLKRIAMKIFIKQEIHEVSSIGAANCVVLDTCVRPRTEGRVGCSVRSRTKVKRVTIRVDGWWAMVTYKAAQTVRRSQIVGMFGMFFQSFTLHHSAACQPVLGGGVRCIYLCATPHRF